MSKTQTSTVYGNGASESYSYNLYGELTEKTLSNGGSFSWKYDSLGNLIYEKDNVNSQKTYYHYDKKGRLYGEKVNSTVNSNAYANELYSNTNTLDDEGNVTKNSLSAGGDDYSTSYSYTENEDESSTETTTISSSRKVIHNYDSNYKLISKNTTTTTPLNETFSYNDDGNVMQHVIGSDTYGYTYDDNGNITQITKNGTLRQSYVYDANNQLIRENNLDTNKTIIYTYDNGGNIVNRKEYAYTTGTVGTATDTISYTYDSTWKDKLTSYDGQSITYDAIGNPTNYMGATMTWFGRQMQSYSDSDTAITYKYDSDGLRTQKVVNGVQYDYYYVDGQLRYEKKGSEYELIYRYNNDGTLASITRYRFSDSSTTTLYAVTNTRGDVIKLLNDNGTVNSIYTYDSWGKVISVTSSTGATRAENTMAVQSSIRYRGYVYDTETGLYYLQSRYYDPETGRFLNADDVNFIGASGTVIGYNAFAYCENNPIVLVDYNGNSFSLTFTVGAATLYSIYKKVKFVLAGITFFNTVYAMKKSGVFTVLGNALYEYVKGLKTTAKFAIDQLKTALNKAVEKAKAKVKTIRTNKHHIIAKNDYRAERSRYIWVNKLGYSIDSPTNLITINLNLHIFLHTNVYHASVKEIIEAAYNKGGKNGVKFAMGLLRAMLYTASVAVG